MKPVCLKECSTCDKLPIDHTFRELHEHYGYRYLIEFIENRTTIKNKSMMNKIQTFAMIIEQTKMTKQFMSLDFKIFEEHQDV